MSENEFQIGNGINGKGKHKMKEEKENKENKEGKQLNMDKVKQITLIVLAVALIGVGFANYEFDGSGSGNSDKIAVVRNEDMIGDVQLVSSNALVENENVVNYTTVNSDIVENFDNNENASASEANISGNEYFSKTKLERDTMYSKMLESYQKILENKDLVETQKAIAVQEISNINKTQNAIMITENLIINKGYENVVVLVNNDVINVVIKSAFLSQEDISKIQNIIIREFKVDLENVSITSRK